MGTPVLIMTLGPTGSGKGSCLKKLEDIDIIKLEKEQINKAIVDELVVENKYYKDEMKNLLSNNGLITYTNEANIRNFILNLEEYKYQKIEQLYFETRYLYDREGKKIKFKKDKEKPNVKKLIEHFKRNSSNSQNDLRTNNNKNDCDFKKNNIRFQKRPECKNLDGSIEKINDDKIEKAFKEGKNLLIESTGSYFPGWLFNNESYYYKNYIGPKKYKVLFIWNYVGVCTLVERVLDRTVFQIKEFLEDNSKDAPRFPNFNRILGELPNIRKTLIEGQTLKVPNSINFYIDNSNKDANIKKLDINSDLKALFQDYENPISKFQDFPESDTEFTRTYRKIINKDKCESSDLTRRISKNLISTKNNIGGGVKRKRKNKKKNLSRKNKSKKKMKTYKNKKKSKKN